MKWTEEKINYLKENYDKIHYHNIAKYLNTTPKAIRVKCTRLNLSLNDFKWEVKQCLFCKKAVKTLKCENRKFCSQTCSGSYSNINRTVESREKQKTTLKKTLNKIPKVPKLIKPKKEFFCKICEKVKENKLYKYCNSCRNDDLKIYRKSSKFNFSIKEFSFLFSEKEINLLRNYKMYSASNRGGNLKGVSRDHKYSVLEGFKNKVDLFVINHPANCELMLHEDNNFKNSKCSITLLELYKQIIKSEKIKQFLSIEELKIVTEKLGVAL